MKGRSAIPRNRESYKLLRSLDPVRRKGVVRVLGRRDFRGDVCDWGLGTHSKVHQQQMDPVERWRLGSKRHPSGLEDADGGLRSC